MLLCGKCQNMLSRGLPSRFKTSSVSPSRTGETSRPLSRSAAAGSRSVEVRARMVGKKSSWLIRVWDSAPAAMPGPTTIMGTRIPPSSAYFLPFLSGKLSERISWPRTSAPPLSEVKITYVVSMSFLPGCRGSSVVWSRRISRPRLQSTVVTMDAK